MLRNQNQGGAGDRVPSANRDLLEQSRLSRLPERKPFTIPNLSGEPLSAAVAACLGCGGRLDLFDQVQESIRACRKCLQVYANLDTAFDKKAERDKQELLEKFAGVK
ncbi:MAG: hypothetical protein WKF90_12125 [Pyrinomonadaceae bacterium]